MNCNNISVEKLKNLINKKIEISLFDCLKSTNLTAKQKAEDGAPEGSIIIARSQTGGRGRLGRSFYSPEKSGVYFSLILKPDFSPEDITFITPITAVAVSLAIEKITKKPTGIKWVNDIFVNGKKVCGILSEAVFSSELNKFKYIILGIGINLFTPENGFPDDIKDIAGGLLKNGEEIDINSLLAQIFNNFFEMYKSLKSPEYLTAYREHLMLKNKEVTYIQNGKTQKGTILDIDESFSLIIKNESGKKVHLKSGEVTIGSKEALKNEL